MLKCVEAQVAMASILVWDFDGVVADTEPVQGNAYLVMLRKRGILPTDDFFRPYVGHTEPEIWEGLRADFDLKETVDALKAERADVYLDMARASLRPAWYVAPILQLARERGLRSIIVSSGNDPAIRDLLNVWDLAAEFDDVLALGSASSSELPTKSDRLTWAIRSTSGEALVIEDSAKYLTDARAQGARTIGVQHSLNDLSATKADCVVPITDPAQAASHT